MASIEALDRVMMRLAVASEDALPAILGALLPQLMALLSPDMDVLTRTKVLEILSHISKRVRDRTELQLPVAALLEGLHGAPSVRVNFIIVFLKLGLPRLQPSEIDSLWPLLVRRSLYPEGARDYLLGVALANLPSVHVPPHPPARAAKFDALLSVPADAAALVTALADTLLFVKPFGMPTGSPAPLVPPGLSLPASCRVVGAEAVTPEALHAAASRLSYDDLLARKRAAIRIATTGVLGEGAQVTLGLAACGDAHHEIVAGGEDLLRRSSGTDVESPPLVAELTSLVLGAEGRSPASLAARLRALAMLTRSKRGATSFPSILRVIFEAWFGGPPPSTPNGYRLQGAGCRLAQTAFQLAPPQALAPLAPLFVQGLVKLLAQAAVSAGEGSEGGPRLQASPSPSSPATLISALMGPGGGNPGGSGLTAVLESRDANERARVREAAYSALGTLAVRAPSAFSSSSAVPRLLFERLGSEEAASRLAVAEALSALATVYSHRRSPAAVAAGMPHPVSPPSVLEEVRDLLDTRAGVGGDGRARLAAVEWAATVFPFSDVRARYTCCRLVGDARPEVREAARAGLRPYGSAGRRGARGAGGGGRDADRGSLSGIALRGAGEDAPASGEQEEVDVLGDVSSFAQLAGLYPLFQSLVRFATALGEVEEERSGRVDPMDVVEALSSPTGAPTSALVDMVLVYVDQPDGSSVPLGRTITRLPCLSLAALLELTNTCLAASATVAGLDTGAYVTSLEAGGGGGLTVLHAYRSLLEHALGVSPAEPDAGRLHETAASCLSQLLASAPPALTAFYASRPAWMLRWLGDGSVRIRRSMARVLGTAGATLPLETGAGGGASVAGLVADLTRIAGLGDARALDTRHGAVAALGTLIAAVSPRARTAHAPSLAPAVTEAVVAIIGQLSARYSALREAGAGAVAGIARTGPLPLPVGEVDAVASAIEDYGSTFLLDLEGPLLAPIVAGRPTLARLVLHLFALAVGRLAEASDSVGRAEGKDDKEGTGRGSASTEAAAVCLGAIVAGEARADPASTTPLLPAPAAALAALLSLSSHKFEQTQFGIGAALVEACGGRPAVLTGGVVGGEASFLLGDTSSEGAFETDTRPPPTLSPSSLAVLSTVLRSLLGREGPLASTRPVQRASGAVWLLSLTAALGTSPPLASALPALQAAFSRLLGEKSAFVQEVAGKGLALVYDLAPPDSAVRSGLVMDLLDTFGTGKKGGGGAVGGGGEMTDEANAPSGPASMQLSAAGEGGYKELCAMANEAGQPDLIYRFLALASHNGAWHARGGAGVGLEALLRTRARSALAPHLPTLIPRLFRYQYDPSPRVREPCERLWALLVRDPSRTVAAHVVPILAELARASESSHWRERHAACAGLADLLPGRTYGEVGPLLEVLWRSCLRSIDDIKDSVREVALGALKALGRLTLRLTDPAHTPAAEARAAVSIVLPFLLRDGVTSPVKEAAGACLGYVREVAKVAGPLLRPHLAELTQTALTALSALEPEQLAYLQQHADADSGMLGAGMPDAATLEAARIAATRSGPLGDVLERVLAQVGSMNSYELGGVEAPAPGAVEGPAAAYLARQAGVDGGGMEVDGGPIPATHASTAPVLPATGLPAAFGADEVEGVRAGAGPLGAVCDVLRGLVRSGVGLPTRGATARFATSLAGAAGDAMAPHAGPLLRALANGLEDSSPSLRREFASAAAAVARYARPGAVRTYLDRVRELARSPEDACRVTAGQALLSLSRGAPEQLAAHSASLLPLAFLASLDPSEKPREVWAEAWEGLMGGGGEAALQLHTHEIVVDVCGALSSSAWVVKRQGAAATVALVDALRVKGGGGALTPLLSRTPAPLLLPPAHLPSSTLLVPPPCPTPSEVRDALLQHTLPLQPPTCPLMRPHVGPLLTALLVSLPGRAWEGKEELVRAAGALLAHVPSAFTAEEGGGEDLQPLQPSFAALARAAARATAPLPFVTAAATALTLAALAHPGLVTWTGVAAGVTPLLERLGRSSAASTLQGLSGVEGAGWGPGEGEEEEEALPPPPKGATAGGRLLGRRHDEEKEGEERAAAREARAEEGRTVATACSALAAAIPLGLAPPPRGAPPPPSPSLLDVLAHIGGAPEAGSTLAALVCAQPSAEAEQGRVARPTVAVLLACYAQAEGAEDKRAIARAVGLLATRLSPPTLLGGPSPPLLLSLLLALLAAAEGEDKFPAVRAALLGAAAALLQRAAATRTLAWAESGARPDLVSALRACGARLSVLTEAARDPGVKEAGGAGLGALGQLLR